MKKLCVVTLLVCLGSFIAGCSQAPLSPWDATMYSRVERDRRLAHGANLQMMMLLDDFDRVLLIDRSTTLMPWHNRVGI